MYVALYSHCKTSDKPFLIEEVREKAEGCGLPVPPSRRAWGAIVIKAKRIGIIKRVGYGQVSNPYAHRANASMWVSTICLGG